MKKHPFVSVIVPAFQDQEGVLKCLGAIERQNYPKDYYEIVIVDNGSYPPIFLPETCSCRVALVRHTTAGSYAARNAGVVVARGDILAFTDADCVPDEDWIATGVAALQSCDVDSVIGGEVEFIPPANRTATVCYQLAVGFQQEENIRRKGFSVTANLFCTRTVYEKIGPFDEQLLSGGDLEWGCRAKEVGVKVVFEPILVVRTLPRMSLSSAICQARRVAGGRFQLVKSAAGVPSEGLRPHRGIIASVWMLLRAPELSSIERLNVIAIAATIKLAGKFERIRLWFGGVPERR